MTVAELALERRTGRTLSARAFKAVAAFSVLTAALAPLGYVSVFSRFADYDDEGYFLITLRDYIAGHPLFTQALPIYGPFYYEVVGGLFKVLGLAPSNDAGRAVTLAVWLATSLAGALVALRLTRSLTLGLAAELVVFKLLTVLTNEPVQPAGLIALLLVLLAAVATFRSRSPRLTAALAGALVAALCLVKINVGAFAAVPVAFAWAGSLPAPWRRFTLPAGAVLMTAAPLLLTAGLIDRVWVLAYASLAAISAAALGVACVASPPAGLPRPDARWLLGGGAAVTALCSGIALAGGTRLADMWNSLVVLAFKFPEQIYIWPVRINRFADLWAVIWLAAAVLLFNPFRRVRVGPGAEGLVRITVAVYTWLSILLLPSSLYLLALPAAWIATQAPEGGRAWRIDPYCRLLLPALALIENLQLYPVAGTQLSLAALMLVPVGAIAFRDGLDQLEAESRTRLSRVVAAAARPSALGVALAVVLLVGLLTASDFSAWTPLGLPGAQALRVPPGQAAQLRGLVGAIDSSCSTFITMPGMDSLYVWSEKDPPVELSSEVWWLVLDSEKQQAIVDRLQATPGVCVVKNPSVVAFWAEGRDVPQRPLVQYIDQNFAVAGTYGDYQLLVRR